MVDVATSELILGGQKSGKSRRAETLARDWLLESPQHHAVLIATAQPWDDEMRSRIARHQADRALRVPSMTTVEEPMKLAEAIQRHSHANTLVVVDCLTLWLTNLLMPVDEKIVERKSFAALEAGFITPFLKAIEAARSPVVLVGNEIGLGVIPLGAEVRTFVDALGQLNQAVAQACQRVTLMVAGLPLTLKATL